MRASVARFIAIIAFCFLFESNAAPYPPEGLPIEWTQPDGTLLRLRVFGDEFHGRTETESGQTVIYDDALRAYCFARVSADGTKLESTGVIVEDSGGPVVKNAGGVKLRPDRAQELWEKNPEAMIPELQENWKAKVRASRQRRLGNSPAANPSSPEGEESSKAVSEGNESAIEPAVLGSKVGLTILVQFPDDAATGAIDPVNFPTTQTKVERYSNEIGYNDDGNSGSVRDYFLDQSLGALDYTQIVTPIVTLPNPRNYYNFSDYPTNNVIRETSGPAGRLIVQDAVAILKSQGFDFSALSKDGANRILATNVFFAGPTSGVWSKGLWPHKSGVSPISVGTAQDPLYVYQYQITNAQTAALTIGTFCHENGHLLLFLPDLYDYGRDDIDSEGIGRHGLMGSGNHLNGGKTPAPINAYFKDVSGWGNITDLTANSFLEATLPSTGNFAYRIRKPGSISEYFIVENRGAGDRWANFSPDKGILIWHVDEEVSGNESQQMTSLLHYEVSVEQADGDFDLENNRNRGDTGDLFDSSTGPFDDTTTPDAKWWDGTDSGIFIDVLDSPGSNMRVQFGSQPPNTITLQAPNPGDIIPNFGVRRIEWIATIPDNVRIELYKGGTFHSIIASGTPNDGLFRWRPDRSLPIDDDYSIRLSSVVDQGIEIFSGEFGLEEVLFGDGFENGSFEPEFWTISGSGADRTIVTANNGPNTGSRHMTMDSSSGGTFSNNQATLTVDIEEGIGIILEFYAKDFTDEGHAPPASPFGNSANFDGVAISTNGTQWYEVQALRGTFIESEWQKYTVDLDAVIATHGLTYTRDFKIRFNHYDNYSIGAGSPDGIAIDDIKIFGDIVRKTTLTLNSGSDTGSSNADRITNNARPFFNGTCRENLTLTLHSHRDGALGTFNTGGTGNWSFRPASNMSDGTHNLTISGDATSFSILSVRIDTRSPSVMINKAAGQADPAASGPVSFTAVFDEPVSGFATNEVSVSGTIAGGVALSGGPSTYTATVVATGGDGNIAASIAGGVATDTAGNANTASTSTDNEIVVDGHGSGNGQATAFSIVDTGGGNGSGSDTGWLFGSDVDSFSFSIASPKRVEITTTGSTNTIGSLYDSNDALINSPSADDNAGVGLNFLITRVLPAGDYRVDLTNGAGVLAWEYDVLIEISDPPLLINEIDSLTFEDSEMEFIELYDGGRGGLSLDGKVLVFFDGNSDDSYHAIDLDGISTDANGYLVIGSDDLPQTDVVIADGLLKNGPAAVALYDADDSDFPNGTGPTQTDLLDAVVYLPGGSNDNPGLAPLLIPNDPQLEESANGFEIGQSLQRIPNGIGELRSGGSFLAVAPTPGAENDFPEAPTFLDLLTEDDRGISDSDNLTSVVQPRFSGIATPGAIVILKSSHEGLISTVHTSRDGSFSVENHGIDFRATAHDVTAENSSNSATSAALEVTIDNRRPTVTINQAIGQADPTTEGPIRFEVNFDEDVHGFSPQDIQFLSSLTGPVSITGGPRMYEASIGMDTDEGFLEVTIPEGAAFDDAGNLTRLATHTDNSVILDVHGATEEDSTAVPLAVGLGAASGWVQPGDSDWFAIELTEPRKILVSTTGGVDTIGKVMDMDGNVLNIPHLDDDRGNGDNFLISLTLEAGQYFVEVAGRGQSSGQYTLSIDATEPPFVQPDLAVGRNASNVSGNDIYDDVTQQSLSLHSYYAATASGTVTIQNDGEVTDDFTVSAPPGNSVFGVQYSTWQDGNITAELIAGTYRIEDLAPGESAPPIIAIITPNYNAVRQVVSRKVSGKKLKKMKKKMKGNVSAAKKKS